MRSQPSDNFSSKFAHFVLRYRWPIIVLALLISVTSSFGLQFITISTEPRDNFGPDNPQLIAFEDLEEKFSRVENIFIAIAPDDGQVFTPRILGIIDEFTEEAWRTRYVNRVDSLTNYQHTYADGDDLIVENLVEFPDSLSDDALAEKRNIAISEPLVVNRLISGNGRVAGMNIDFRFNDDSGDIQEDATNWVRRKKAEIMARYPDVKVYATGSVMISASFSETARKDLTTQTPIMYVFIFILIGLLLRSYVGVFSIFVVTMLSIVSALGLFGWADKVISTMSSTAPIIILTVVVAHSIHILVSYYQGIRDGREKYAAMHEAIDLNLQPIILTSLSTAIGFLSLNFLADVPPIQDVGNIVTVGVVFGLIFSLTLLPALVYILPNRVKPAPSRTVASMNKIADWVIQYRTRLLIVNSTIAILLMSLAPLNIISDQFSKYFKEHHQIRIDTDFLDDSLGGLYLIEYALDTGVEQGVSNPDYLKRVEDFANWYRQQPEVMHVSTYTDILKRLNKNLNGDQANHYLLPANQELAAQYLLLYELSLPFGLDLTNQLNFDKSSSRMRVSFASMATPDFVNVQERAKNWLGEHAPDFLQEGSSLSMMFTHIGIRSMKGSIKGALIALGLISIVLIVSLNSVRMGLISIIPNLLPGMVGFGVWYLIEGRVGMSTSMVLGITMGIVVDDTVHFLSKYIRARRDRGLSVEDGIRYAFSTVGVALWVTTLVLVVGFLILSTSDLSINGDTGLLVAIVIAIALAFDFILLPPLLMLLDRGKWKQSESTTLEPISDGAEPISPNSN
ncbi:MAG: MMPL family transporter [Gammaproteobacteria bacterium]|jgi:uncharacterized protein|nr:MMPL family transporter [Gammaproteobacteria bacterium]MBT5204131.1 MMPL family transporter [Gammaproteobacteria bacterium]MBT5602634.1 MMPL family transporter [Gammaproteobacteria bacterium]MBT6244661.1 MMPL family transporter [Gammaproteobacteria bacterium]